MSARHSPDNKFLTETPGRIFARTAAPMVAILTMNGLLGVIDAIFLGRFVGVDAMTAVGIAFPVVMLTIALSTLVSSGMSSLLARQLGAGAREAAGATFARAHGLAIAIALGLLALFLLGGWHFASRMAGPQGPVALMVWQFLLVTILGLPIQFLLGLHADAWRNEGQAGRMALLSLGVTLLNIVLNYIMIVPLHLGVAGSAASTVLAQGIGLCLLVEGRRRSKTMLPLAGLRRNNWLGPWADLVALGAPVSLAFIGMALTSSCVILALPATEAGNLQTIAAYGIIMRVLGFAFLPMMALALAMQSIVGNNVGAGRHDRARHVLKIAAVTALVYCALVQLLLFTESRSIASAFVADGAVIGEVGRILALMTALYFISGPVFVLGLYFQAIGKPGHAGLLTLSKSFIFIPLAIIVITLFLTPEKVWLAFSGADAVVGAVGLVLLLLAMPKPALTESLGSSRTGGRKY